jgi:hypothetical protein
MLSNVFIEFQTARKISVTVKPGYPYIDCPYSPVPSATTTYGLLPKLGLLGKKIHTF